MVCQTFYRILLKELPQHYHLDASVNNMNRAVTFNGELGQTHNLVESDDMIIVRTHGGVRPEVIFSGNAAISEIFSRFELMNTFSDASAFVYKLKSVVIGADLLINELKLLVAEAALPQIRFVGSVFVYAKTGIYQIYTGNIFIKFYDELSYNNAFSILLSNGFVIKRQLEFIKNGFFCEPVADLGRNIFDKCQELLRLKPVEYCHPELVVRRRSLLQNDNTAAAITALENNWVLKKVEAEKAWQYSRGANTVICVIDDGLDFAHPAFSIPGKIIYPVDLMDKQRKRLPGHAIDDMHGTGCASIACSADIRFPGMAPDARLMPIRSIGLGSITEAEAFVWAANNGADIISCSWGPPDGNFTNQTDDDYVFPIPDHTNLAIKYAAEKGRNGKGCLVFFAAGNGKEPLKNDQYASHEMVMAIGSSNDKDESTVFSDYGPPLLCCFPSGDYTLVDNINQPTFGSRVADIIGDGGFSKSEFYDFFNGTSASCPGAAGIAALMLSLAPELTREQAKQIIIQSCKKIGNQTDYQNNISEKYGNGLLMANNIIQNTLAFNKKRIIMDTTKTIGKGYALHIGINFVDTNFYGNHVPVLDGCVADMESMEKMARAMQFNTETLQNEAATKSAILSAFAKYAKLVGPGDFFLVTYAGHGAPIIDTDGDEEDGFDESWVTYDQFLLDDEIKAAFQQFVPDANVVLISDSCHSGSVNRVFAFEAALITNPHPTRKRRYVPLSSVTKILSERGMTAASLQQRTTKIDEKQTAANYLLLAACQDKEFAQEELGHGIFTSNLIKLFNTTSDKSTLTYENWLQGILNAMPSDQHPRIDDSEVFKNKIFSTQKIFDFGATIKTDTIVDNPNPVASPPKTKNKTSNKIKSIILDTEENYIHSAQSGLRGVAEDSLRVVDKSVFSESLPGKTEWDKAYQLLMANSDKKINFVEPDNAATLFTDATVEDTNNRGVRSDEGYLFTYPNPQDVETDNEFIWHLEDNYSQLRSAFQKVFSDLYNRGLIPDESDDLVTIAHIDTGYLHGHPLRPIFLDEHKSTSFSVSTGDLGSPEDENINLLPDGVEQQGHGNATLSLLAGNKVDISISDGKYAGYFGGNPFAKIISIKAGESVVLLSGKAFAKAIDHAIKNNCDVVTMSMAGWPTQIMADAVNRAYEAGIVIVSAAGNSWVKGGKKALPTTLLYPARYDRVIAAVGATCKYSPYLYDQNLKLRSEGGLYMQMNYGPDEAMKTAIAGYTPNVMWFHRLVNKAAGIHTYYVQSGGGTSSATPQVAAAASLYIQYYKKELSKYTGANAWKKVEIVKLALFKSADNSNPSNRKYFGNGLLKAAHALDFHPDELVKEIKKAAPAMDEGGFFKKLFGLFRRRGIDDTAINEQLGNMMQTEVLQLLHLEPALHPLLAYNLNNDANQLSDADLQLLYQTIATSPYASDFLKRNLRNNYANDPLSKNSRSISFENVGQSNIILPTETGDIIISVSGMQCNIIEPGKKNKRGLSDSTTSAKKSKPKLNGQNWVVDEVEIEVMDIATRGDNPPKLDINSDIDTAELQQAMLVTKHFEDDEPLMEWMFPGKTGTTSDGKRNFGSSELENEIGFSINLNGLQKSRSRGPLKKIFKIGFKIFKWKKPQADIKIPEKGRAWLRSIVDTDYEIKVYDMSKGVLGNLNPWSVDTLTPKIVEEINNSPLPVLICLPGLVSKIEKGFDEYFGNDTVTGNLIPKCCRYVIGINMPTVTDGIKANAEWINTTFKKAGFNKNKSCIIIARSRGGIVSRYLNEVIWNADAKAPFKVKKLIMTGTPNEGTHIADYNNLRSYVNLVSNVISLPFGATPIAGALKQLVGALANGIVNLPGVNDLELESNLIEELNGIVFDRNNYHVITSNYEPNNKILRLIEEGIIDRKIFHAYTNDTIVPVLSALFELTNKISIPANHKHIVSGNIHVTHFEYLKPELSEIQEILNGWL